MNPRTSQPLQVSAWPDGTFVASGRVREPGLGGIDKARVLEPRSVRSTLTDSLGRFSIAGIASARLTIEKEGYEGIEFEALPNNANDVAMQRVVRVTAGDTVTSMQLAPHDVSYAVGADRCYPCRLIRVVNLMAGTLRLSLTWTNAQAALNLWANGRLFPGSHPELIVNVPVSSGEVVLYVGLLLPPPADTSGFYVPFTLATAIRSAP